MDDLCVISKLSHHLELSCLKLGEFGFKDYNDAKYDKEQEKKGLFVQHAVIL